MDSAISADLAGGSTRGTASTGSVSVFDTARNASTRSMTAHTAFFSSMSGFTTVDTTRTCSIWGSILRILPKLSAIRPLMLTVHQVFTVLSTFKSSH